jgi:hypothetical protein
MTRPTTARSSAPAKRRAVAAESFRTAADCIGDVEPGMSLFAITRGQFSMIDAVLHVLDAVGPARLSLWTWTIADYELDVFRALMGDGRVTDGRLVIDFSARKRNAGILADWRTAFGRNSIRTVVNHAKIATVEGNGLRVLLRGSMNLNFNPRFEQLDITEGGRTSTSSARLRTRSRSCRPTRAGWSPAGPRKLTTHSTKPHSTCSED